MKLSMWMIANRLQGVELTVDLSGSDGAVLKSARRAYASDCVYVCARGRDTVCRADAGTITLRDIPVSEGFELVQEVFDSYNEWQRTTEDAVRRGEYQPAIEMARHFFHNPLLLLDGSFRVLGMLRVSRPEEIGAEWTYLQRWGQLSVHALTRIRQQNSPGLWDEETVRPFTFRNGESRTDGLYRAVKVRGRVVGRLVLVEHRRPVNPGDSQLLAALGDCFAAALTDDQGSESPRPPAAGVLDQLLAGESVDPEALDRYLAGSGWERGDLYQAILIRLRSVPPDPRVRALTRQTVAEAYPGCVLLEAGDDLLLVHNVTRNGGFRTEKLSIHFTPADLTVGKSLHASGAENLRWLYRQAGMAIAMSRWNVPAPRRPSEAPPDAAAEDTHMAERGAALPEGRYPVWDFYYCALDFLLLCGDLEEALVACHPDVRMLWRREGEQRDSLYQTFSAYLENGCSLKNTAEAMFLHKNTLRYRMQKIQRLVKTDLNKSYNRLYMTVSARVIRLWERRRAAEAPENTA